jgi:DNA-binding GntR family transcriptional regulator
VREALQRLEADGLVRIMPRFGIQITEVSIAHQLLLLEVHRVLERLTAQSAARRASAEERDTMLRMATELERLAGNYVLSFLRYHCEVKVFLARYERNAYVAVAIAPMHAVSRRFYFLHYRTNHDMPLAAALHAGVLRAVAIGDHLLSSEAADRLMVYVENLTRATVLQPTLSLLQCDVDIDDSRP